MLMTITNESFASFNFDNSKSILSNRAVNNNPVAAIPDYKVSIQLHVILKVKFFLIKKALEFG